MKHQLLALLSFTILALTSCQQKKNKVFTLEGEIAGPQTEFLVLQYTDSLGNYTSDTISIENNKFSLENPLHSPQQVALTSNLTGRDMEDPNRLRFFLEPENIKISLKEGQFSQAKITGSATQIESENLKGITAHYYEEIENLINRRQELINQKQESDNNYNLDQQIDSLTNRWQKILKKIENIQLEYAFEHDDSYISADIINFYRRTLSQDSLKIFYNNFTPAIKESWYGNKIKEQIELYVVDSGDQAPNFRGKNINEGEISLNQFSGKVVILDFMAGWCIPCIKNHPHLKELYSTYNHRGLEIISISFDKDEESWKNNVNEENLTWNHIYQGLDNIGKEGTISKLYTIQPIPAYILINEKGIIVNRYSGADKNNKNLDDLENDLKVIFFESRTFTNNI